jgi:hypothetical protein
VNDRQKRLRNDGRAHRPRRGSGPGRHF